jgi:hypothetical protein
MVARLMALDFQYLEIGGVEFDTYWQNGGYKKISDIIFAEWHIFIVSNLCRNGRAAACRLLPPQALVVSWEGHDFERACGIL